MGEALAHLDGREAAAAQQAEQSALDHLARVLDGLPKLKSSGNQADKSGNVGTPDRDASAKQGAEQRLRGRPNVADAKPGSQATANPGGSSGKQTGPRTDQPGAFTPCSNHFPPGANFRPASANRCCNCPPRSLLPKYQEMIEDYYRRLSEPPPEGANP